MSNDNAIRDHGTIESTDGRSTQLRSAAGDGERQQARKPRRFGWLFEEWVFQALLVVAVLVALVDGLSSVNHIPIA